MEGGLDSDNDIAIAAAMGVRHPDADAHDDDPDSGAAIAAALGALGPAVAPFDHFDHCHRMRYQKLKRSKLKLKPHVKDKLLKANSISRRKLDKVDMDGNANKLKRDEYK